MKQVVLYNHNKTTYENIVRIFENDNKCAAVQPTGSGKSFLIFKLAQDNSDKTVVVFEPNKQIISRVSEQMKEYGIENIKFYTYQKLNSQHKRDEISIDNVDYICLDELHRIKAKQWGQSVEAIQDKFPNAKVLGLTATPERMDGQNIIDYFGAELACNITLGDAIVNKILPCPTYISALYTFDEEVQRVYDKINESRNSDEEKEEMRAELESARKQLENALGVPKILEKHIPDNNGKYIVFCQSVEHLNTMQSVIEDWFVNAGFEIHTYAVHTKNPNRETEYKSFQTDNSDCIKLCLCVDMFNEGVHLEGITGVILLRPTQSNIVYFQQIGRAISASDEETPIIFDLVNNGNYLGSGNLRTEIESVTNRQKDNEIRNKDKDNDIFDIGDFHIYDYVTESLNIFSNIKNKCEQVESNEERWVKTFNIAKDYIRLHNKPIALRTKYKGYNIGTWLQTNKKQYFEGKMSLEKEKLLREICDLDISNNQMWNEKYNLLKKYIELNHNVKRNSVYNEVNLGVWYHNQFSLYKQGRLSDDRIKKLKLLGLLNSENERRWEYNLNLITEFINNNGVITNKTIYRDFKMGMNIYAWKQQYKQGRFPKKRYQQLLDLGIDLAKKGCLM